MSNNNIYVVALGTSAGGLEALERFFTNMPAHEHLAFLVIQHLSPDYKSHMVELLSKHSKMPVHEARDGVEVEPGNVYLLPPRKNMTIFNNTLYLVDYDRSLGLNLPIDILFESLAKDRKTNAISCILSGTGSDGTRGIRAIKEHGGIVLAQDDTAKFDGMPRSAINTQLVDYVAPAEQMPEIILRYVSHPQSQQQSKSHNKLLQDKDMMGKILAILRDNNNVDFTGYKPNTLVRRIERRMNLIEIASIEQYADYLQQSPTERKILFKEFLISVTSFFRDPEAFEFIQEHVIPNLLDSRNRGEQIRVWIPGCATGEEAYSLAILLQEHMEHTGRFADVKIFATDIDRDALERAGQGVYPESIMADIAPNLLQNYFIKEGERYQILRQIRSMVVFAYQNIITDPPFSRIDVVCCRNLLIYLTPEVQNRILSIFQFALKPNGYLFLGSSESLGEKSVDFTVENSKWKIYRYRGMYQPLLHNDMGSRAEHISTPLREPIKPLPSYVDWSSSDQVLRKLVETALPPCLVVDESYSMLHAFGDLDPYLRAPTGFKVNLNVLKLVREELSIPLSTALHRTLKNGEEVNFDQLDFKYGTDVMMTGLTTRILWRHNQRQRLALIVFQPVVASDTQDNIVEHFNLSDSVNQRINNLEQELQYTRENLQATIEELETSNEELQATNEELMAANEELQSTNEELESVNEELLTVNNEYQAKIKELGALNDDVNNLLRSIEIGTIFLDSELNVRKFNPAAQKAISLLDQDIGRPINHFAHNLVEIHLVEIIQKVLESLIPTEHETQDKSGQWYLLRAAPYRTHMNQISGIVLTMVDISELKLAASIAEKSSAFARIILNSLTAHIAVLDESGTIIEVNDAWNNFAKENGDVDLVTGVGSNYLQVSRQSAVLSNVDGAQATFDGLRALLAGEIDEFDLEYPCHAPHEKRWFMLRAVPLKSHEGSIVVSHINITANKLTENAMRLNEKRYRLAANEVDITLFEQNADLEYVWIDGDLLDESAMGKTDAELWENEAEIDCLVQLKQKVLDSGEPIRETITLTLAGISHHCDVTIELFTPYDDEPNRIIGSYSNYQ